MIVIIKKASTGTIIVKVRGDLGAIPAELTQKKFKPVKERSGKTVNFRTIINYYYSEA